MRIEGMQTLTLLDFPGRVACTLFTGGCNFRCPFCHNADLVLPGAQPQEIGNAELFAFLNKRKGILDGVCITGGEPLMHPEIKALTARIKALGYAVKLDTNGAFPERLREMCEEGLVDMVAMDIKNAPNHYAATIGVAGFDLAPVAQSVDFLLQNAVPYEFRTTVVRELHTEADFIAIAKWLKGARHYYLQAFVDSGNLIMDGLHACSLAEMQRFRQLVQGEVPSVELRGV